MKRSIIIVAGGKGTRMGSDLPKQFIPLHGKPVLMYTLEAFHRWDASAQLLTAIPDDCRDYWAMLCRELNCAIPHRIVGGGETRCLSVRNALREVGNDGEMLVAIHDGVRPFVSPSVISACFEAAATFGAAIPVIRMVDSVREVTDGTTSRAFDRNRLRVVQTPQVFRYDILRDAYGLNRSLPTAEMQLFTDDASLVEAAGYPIHLVEGDGENIKITTPADLRYAELLLNNKTTQP